MLRLPPTKCAESGFALAGFLILLPFMITIFAVLAAGYLTITSDGKARHICRVELLKSQATVSEKLNSLIQLNPEAEELRVEREIAEQMVKNGVETGPGEIYLTYHLNQVIAEQVAFSIKQKSLIAQATLESAAGPLRAHRAVQKALGNDQKVYRGDSSIGAIRGSPRSATFEVDASPQDSITPDYQPKANFQSTQNMQVKWNIQVLPFLPKWLTDLINMSDLNLKADCSATLTNGDNKWSPRLNAAKSLSNFW